MKKLFEFFSLFSILGVFRLVEGSYCYYSSYYAYYYCDTVTTNYTWIVGAVIGGIIGLCLLVSVIVLVICLIAKKNSGSRGTVIHPGGSTQVNMVNMNSNTQNQYPPLPPPGSQPPPPGSSQPYPSSYPPPPPDYNSLKY